MTKNETSHQAPRRTMLALIALADLPMPNGVNFHSDGTLLVLDFDRVADGQAWSTYLGGRTGTYVHSDRIWLEPGLINWHGWPVQIHCNEPAPATELDDDTRTQLAEVAAGCAS